MCNLQFWKYLVTSHRLRPANIFQYRNTEDLILRLEGFRYQPQNLVLLLPPSSSSPSTTELLPRIIFLR
ncbi:hypothetical protein AFLA_011978 [Aspergillus flavus NRRL3357]|nr:hypothetical protein AFLA_011978 [Aspergillus flavus NRRL3357]